MSVQCRTWSAVTSAAVSGLLVAGLGACSDDPERDETTGEFSESGEADVFDIAVGDCLSDAVTGDVTEVPVTPCDQPHDSEVFFSYTMEDGPFPGPEGMSAATQEQCLPAFQSFVGRPYEQSALDVTTIEPTSQSWSEGDRELLCLVIDPAGPVTGSLEGANR
jgi:Septum formation